MSSERDGRRIAAGWLAALDDSATGWRCGVRSASFTSRPGSAYASGRRNEIGDLLRFVDLHVVAGRGEQEQIRRRQELVETPGHARIQVRVVIAKDNAHRAIEQTQLFVLAQAAE